jgi:UDPglucose 6-dehydrogenase
VAKKSVAIVGYGAVGRGIHTLFPDAVIYDEPLGIGEREEVNRCEYAFVSVPTPQAPDGACDTSIVEEVCSWIQSDVIILRSTVAVGTTDRLRERLGKSIVFQPEYGPAETPDHPFNDLRKIRWVIVGGDRSDTVRCCDLYKTTFNADITIMQTDARTAELTKYMENCFLALKVTFCNEFYDIAGAAGVDYNELRELWLLDPRIGRSHTFVMPDGRGFGGKCLPKDLSALIHSSLELDYYPHLLTALERANMQIRGASPAKPNAEPVAVSNGVEAGANGRSGRNGHTNGAANGVTPRRVTTRA